MSTAELDKLTEDFLREHDPEYTRKRKSVNVTYPYLSARQLEIRQGKEIPLSNLTTSQKTQALQFGDVTFFQE